MRTILAGVLMVMSLGAPIAAQQPPSESLPVRAIAFLEGSWMGEGTWPDGRPLRVEQRYFWGPTGRVLHFESYDRSGPERRLLYEGTMFHDPARGRIVQWNFRPTGERDESEVTGTFDGGYEVRGPNTWSIVRAQGADELVWELRVPQQGEWREIMRAVYRRQPTAAQRERTASAAEQVVQAQLEAYNRHDLEAFLATYAPDAKIHNHPDRLLMSGVEQMRTAYGRTFGGAPRLHAASTARMVQGDFVIDHEHVTGLPDGGEIRAVAIYEVRGGRIQNVWFIR